MAGLLSTPIIKVYLISCKAVLHNTYRQNIYLILHYIVDEKTPHHRHNGV